MGGNCRLDFLLQCPSIKTPIGRIIFFSLATEKQAVLRRAATTRLWETAIETRWLRKNTTRNWILFLTGSLIYSNLNIFFFLLAMKINVERFLGTNQLK